MLMSEDEYSRLRKRYNIIELHYISLEFWVIIKFTEKDSFPILRYILIKITILI